MLRRRVADRDAQRGRARVVALGREQPAVARRAHRLLEPVGRAARRSHVVGNRASPQRARVGRRLRRRLGLGGRRTRRRRLGGFRRAWRLAMHVEVGAPERATLHVDELRERAPREARVLDARDRLGVGRQAVEIELYDVRAVTDLLEVELAVRIAARVGAVIEQDAHVAHAVELLLRRRALALDDAADQHCALPEERLLHAYARDRDVRGAPAVGSTTRAVDRVARLRARTDLHDVGDG